MKVCKTCGTQNEDVFTRCVACGADMGNGTDYNSAGDDEATVLLDPMEVQSRSSFTIKRDENTYGQEPMGNGMSGQANSGMNYQSQPQIQGGMPNSGYNQNFGYNQSAGGWNQNSSMYQSQPVKANKKMIFIALGAITAVTALVLFIIFGLGKGGERGGVKSPEDVVETFIEAMNDRDVNKMKSICPSFLEPDIDGIEDSWDELEAYEIEFDFIGVTDTYDYDKEELDELEDEIKYDYGINVDIDAACDVEFDYGITGNSFGTTYSETQSDTMIVIKYKDKWFLYE